ncbi:MAG: glycosyltransferase family 2 protein [Ferruginibacter sp.]
MDNQPLNTHPSLAIVIPSYKGNFLAATLEGLAQQTNKNFTVYIDNDASKDDIEAIVLPFKNQLQIVYHRFENNIGGKDLVAQWERCMQLTQNEPWIWLLPDDDVPEDGCVEAFYAGVAEAVQTNVFRFNTNCIDAKGNITTVNPNHPVTESGAAFIKARLRIDRYSTVCEYIFSRAAYESTGGFQAFPLAWFSDDASWLKFAGNLPIVTIPGPRVHIRMSDFNISNIGTGYAAQKANATLQYLLWLKNDFNHLLANELTLDEFLVIAKRFFNLQLLGSKAKLSWLQLFQLAQQCKSIWGTGLRNQFDPLIDFNPTGITRLKLKRFFGSKD